MARVIRKKKMRRNGTSKAKERARVERLIALAAEPVPVGSGLEEHGVGGHCYIKSNNVDGSMRVFRFRNASDADRAMAEGIAADEALLQLET